ncbi:MAG: hypothetical protein KF795_07335 [Labilithrix sp.]|nr:hypothetical protein [Labilithrix sp.]
MIRLRMQRSVLLPAALLLPVVVFAFASCAEAEDSRPPEEDPRSSVPEAGVEDARAPGDSADGGCDASASDCVSELLSCEEAPWCPVPTTVSTRYALTSVWGSGKNDVWAVGSGGTIIHYDGAAWSRTPTPVKSTFRAVWGRSATDVWAVAMTDTIFHTTGFAGGAAEWTRVTDASEPYEARAANAIWGSGAGDLRIGARARSFYDPDTGEFPFVAQFTLGEDADGGVAWEAVRGEGTVLGFWGSSATDLWLVADNSERNGWEKGMIRHGTAAPKGGGLVWSTVDSQSTMTLEGIWGSSADDVWAVGEKGTIRRMTKGASRWAIVSSPTTEALHAIWGSSANDVWAVGDSGTILHFDGASWKASSAAFALGKKPNLYGVWGSAANDVWIVGDSVSLHFTGPKPAGAGGGK